MYSDDAAVDVRHSVGKDDLKILLSSIEEIGPIDLLVFCGDIIIGKDSESIKDNSLNEIGDFINCISKSPKIFSENITHIWDRIIYVPGNHDVDRENRGKILAGVSNLFKFSLSPISTEDHRNQSYSPIFIFDDLKLIVSVISTIDNSCSENKNISKVLEITDELPFSCEEQKNEIKQLIKNYSMHDIPSITSQTISKFIEDSKKISNDDNYKDYRKIMFSHHPLLSGVAPDVVLKRYGDTVGGYGFMRSAKEYGYRLFVHGHLHSTSCVEIIDQLSEDKKQVVQLGLPQMEFDKDNCGCVLIEIGDTTNDFPFKCTLLRPDSIAWKFRQIPLVDYNERTYSSNINEHILVDYEISEIIKENVIVKNGDLNNVEAASYDCSLGNEYKKGKSRFCNWEDVEVSTIKPENNGSGKIILEPNETVLIFSHEEFNIPKDMVLHASPISSWLRKGIRFDISFFVDPGFYGKFSIPVTNESNKTITINAQSPIISLEFIQLSKECEIGWRERHQNLAELRAKMGE